MADDPLIYPGDNARDKPIERRAADAAERETRVDRRGTPPRRAAEAVHDDDQTPAADPLPGEAQVTPDEYVEALQRNQ